MSHEKKNKTFLISDLHLDHENIIKYCKRPFRDAKEMNHVLIKNWNSAILENDLVYYLGDLAFGRGSRESRYYLDKLNGRIILIRGNHDRRLHAEHFKIIHHNGHEFLLIHNPIHRPIDWKGWIIHGHTHNNQMEKYPFINGEGKTINVSVDLLDFKPLDFDYLISLNYSKIRRMDTINSKAEYF